MDPDPRSARTSRLLVLAVWTAIGLLETVKVVVSRELQGFPPLPLDSALINNLPWWYAWAALTPVVVAVARWQPVDRNRLRAVVVHGAAALLLSLTHLLAVGTLFFYTTSRGFGPFAGPLEQVRFFVDGFLLMDLLTYGAIVGVWHALRFRREAQQREVEAARLREQAVQARLDALRMELNPHFLFNALNSVSGLVRDGDVDGATRMLARLGGLLRLTLDLDEELIPLDQETTIVRRYLAIEAVRFRDRLSVRVRVDPAAERVLVPPLILQPLVENAIRHGIRRRTGAGALEVSASVAAGRLTVEVSDDGAGFHPSPLDDGRSVGLANVRERLRTCYGPHAHLEIERRQPGTLVRLVVPARFRDDGPRAPDPGAGGGRRAAGAEVRTARAGRPAGRGAGGGGA